MHCLHNPAHTLTVALLSLALAYIQCIVDHMTPPSQLIFSTCYKRCVGTPSSKLSSSTTSCLTSCRDQVGEAITVVTQSVQDEVVRAATNNLLLLAFVAHLPMLLLFFIYVCVLYGWPVMVVAQHNQTTNRSARVARACNRHMHFVCSLFVGCHPQWNCRCIRSNNRLFTTPIHCTHRVYCYQCSTLLSGGHEIAPAPLGGSTAPVPCLWCCAGLDTSLLANFWSCCPSMASLQVLVQG